MRKGNRTGSGAGLRNLAGGKNDSELSACAGRQPGFDLALHRFEIALNAIHTFGQRVDQVKALAVGQD